MLVATLLVACKSPVDTRCADILAHPENDVVIPLPENCTLATYAPMEQRAKNFEIERMHRGLTLKAWIICNPSSRTQSIQFAYTHDPRWMPSYVPGLYQLRQTVIISPDEIPPPRKPVIAGEVCLMPRERYLSQIYGQCDSKFELWK